MNRLLKVLPIFFGLSVLALLPVFAQEVTSDFKPARWCRGGHAQSIYAGLFRAPPKVPLTRTRVSTPDGDFLDLDFLAGKEDGPLIVVLHGLGSSAQSSYVLTLLEEIQKKGWRAVAVNGRGATGPNLVKRTNHSGNSEDLDFVIQHLIARNPSEKIYLVGYSLGGNVVLKWLGEKGTNAPLAVQKAAVVSVPYDLAKAAGHLDQGFNREVYTRSLLSGLKKHAVEKARRFPGSIDLPKVLRARTFSEVDRELTARLNGFKSEKDYWEKSSSAKFIETIARPALLIHAVNDPFLPSKDIPLDKIRKSPHLHLLLTEDGGHVGFVSGSAPFLIDRWIEQKILAFFDSIT